MSDPLTLKNDIDYMKALAQDGGRRPIINGGSLFWAGITFGAASLIHYGFWTEVIPMPNPWFSAVNWLGAGLIYAVLAVLSIRGSIKKYGHGGTMNVAIGNIWSGIGFAIFVIAMCLIVAGTHMEQMEATMSMLAPAILVLYGLGWWIVSAISGQGWLKFVCFGAFLGATGTSFMAGEPEQFLAYAACLILFATVPGLVIMLQAKKV
jgi:hypothetical protein